VLGDYFTAADIAAALHLPVVRSVAKTVLEWDPLADIAGLDAYLARMEARPTMQQVRADQKADGPKFFEHLQQLRR
jgi:glutathione S-transferase